MKSNKKLLVSAIACTLSGMASTALYAQNSATQTESQGIEEVIVTARLKSSAENIVAERIEHEAITDLMSSALIGRIGDSNVATSLRRVTGVTLVDDKFIYVRGLGERYSSTLLNGAAVPTPDLTRSVLPLDIFPTSIVQSLAVQKAFTADMPAAFGGGNVDIRTKGIPEQLVFNMELGFSNNGKTSGSGLSYRGGGDDEWGTDDGSRGLPSEISRAIDDYQGDISAINIFNFISRQDPSLTYEDAQEINRQLASSLKRDISIYEDNPGENISGELNVGNRFYLDNGWEYGFLGGMSYDHSFDTASVFSRNISDPEEQVERKTESIRTVNITGNLGFGLRLNGEQEISTTSLFIRNTDDVAAIADFHNENRPQSGGTGFRDYDIRYEEREMAVHQIKGRHVWGAETSDLLGLKWLGDKLPFLDQLEFDWYYSDSEVTNDIPSQINVRSVTQTDPENGAVLASSVQLSDSMADYRFTDLDDDVLSEGWQLTWPAYVYGMDVKLSGGWDYVRKARSYRQTDLRLGTTDTDAQPILTQFLSDIFTDENIQNDDFGFSLDISQASARSYLAATTNESAFLKADIAWNEAWRLVAGVRYEEYNQVGLPWEPLNYLESQISTDPEELLDAVFTDDKVYPSLSVVYMRRDFWAETFQLRFGWSETVVRPDLREIADTSYLDPITGVLIFGNPDVVPADLANYDLRAEWFFENGDNFTASLFYKEIDNPIEFFERGATDVRVASMVINAESAELWGVEFEWLKELAFLGEAFNPFFVSGNLTFLDHELIAGDKADSPTNPVRGLAGASDYVANLQFGFDSEDGKHAATLVYNVFGERLYTAGRLGAPDAFEQPFHSLDLTYSYYPTDNFTVKLKLKNLLDESVVIERSGVDIFEEERGLLASLAIQWQL